MVAQAELAFASIPGMIHLSAYSAQLVYVQLPVAPGYSAEQALHH